MTDFEVLAGPSSRWFLKISTDKTTYIVELESGDIDAITNAIDRSPTPVSVSDSDNGENDE
jgi:3-dehydroquinate synthase class II